MIEIGNQLLAINTNPLVGNNVAPPLKLKELYTAKNVYICKCGQDHIDVGLVSRYSYVSCYKCKEELPDGDKIHWCHPTRFEIQ